MNSRERLRRALSHVEPDRVPMFDSVWQATLNRWRGEGLPTEVSVEDFFGYDMCGFSVDTSPLFPVQVLSEDAEYVVERDSFGGVRRNHKDRSTTPEIIDYPCKSREDWERIKPRLQPNDSRVIDSEASSREGKNVQGSWDVELERFEKERDSGRFITYNAAVGYDKIQNYVASPRLLRAIILEPEWVKEMYLTDANLVMAMCDHMMDNGFRFDGAYLFCDLAYRKGLFFSPRHYREQLHPVFKMLCRYFREKNMPIILHSCGRVKELIPDLIEAGFSCLQPLEVKAGMDVRELKREYAGKLALMGGIDVRLMSTENPRLIEEEVESKFQVAKKGGGYIYHSDHSIPKDVSFQQYQRVMELVRRHGEYE